jgi:hypothetical protein
MDVKAHGVTVSFQVKLTSVAGLGQMEIKFARSVGSMRAAIFPAIPPQLKADPIVAL